MATVYWQGHMFWVAAQVRNALGNALLDTNFPLDKCLLHEEFGTSVKNQYQWLLDYLLGRDVTRQDGGPRIYTVLDWALSNEDSWRHPELRIHQISRNAATLLSSPWRKLWEAMSGACPQKHQNYPFQRLLEFINSPMALDPMFAGHFQCIFEAVIRCSHDWIQQTQLDQILNFAIKNIKLQAYHQLVCHMGIDFRDVFSSDERYIIFIQKILFNAA
jgi:hypothetical protein